MSNAKKIAQEILIPAGVCINGNRVRDIQVHNKDFYDRVLSEGSMGLGESYMDGWWDVKRLDEFFCRILREKLDRRIIFNLKTGLWYVKHRLLNQQTISKAFRVGKHHYDIGNDLYQAMLDKRMTYTCGYWKNAKNLNEAQEAKLNLVCRKLNLKKGQVILDIGCGWGSFLKYASEKYKVRGIGITVSQEQVKLGRKLCKGLPVKILLQDYRKIKGAYDHIVSLGMFEHVGVKNYKTYMKVVFDHLKDDGLFLLHTIGKSESTNTMDPWIERYIFPNSMIPSLKQVASAVEGFFVMEDWHNFGTDYDKTLMAWYRNINEHWHELKKRYDRRFYRMWKYYLMASAGSFRSRRNNLWQIVLSKKGLAGGYVSIR